MRSLESWKYWRSQSLLAEGNIERLNIGTFSIVPGGCLLRPLYFVDLMEVAERNFSFASVASLDCIAPAANSRTISAN